MGRSAKALRLAAVTLMAVLELSLVAANFLGDCDITWEPQNAKMDEGGNHLTLSLVSNSSGIHASYLCSSFNFGIPIPKFIRNQKVSSR